MTVPVCNVPGPHPDSPSRCEGNLAMDWHPSLEKARKQRARGGVGGTPRVTVVGLAGKTRRGTSSAPGPSGLRPPAALAAGPIAQPPAPPKSGILAQVWPRPGPGLAQALPWPARWLQGCGSLTVGVGLGLERDH